MRRGYLAEAVCPGCGGRFADVDGPIHRYMTSSPGCWAAYGVVLAREYETPALMPIHRLSVDAYAVQHPGDGSRAAIQSVGLHLARLMVQLATPQPPAETNAAMLSFAARKATLPLLAPPPLFPFTVASVVDAMDPAGHAAAVRRWAQSAWDAWSAHHAFIRDWAGVSTAFLSDVRH